ncbi:site-specific integrase [Thiosulfativibrio zosterae]|uniref:Integrase n=1 Tax=Thiosulfativibrio zosterae TaxID=2675053 RepID=A0A6F8PQD8_9GAMM|nr:site-specific integrase [Thiosulfativibrio zosterae]BBP44296.1 integrase [Thiosulfativibrio zosterae]
MPKQLLSQAFVDKAKCPKGQTKVDYFDTKVNGLLLKVLTSGKTNYYLRYQNSYGRWTENRLSQVDASALNLNDARQLAKQYLSQITLGHNPFEDKVKKTSVITFQELIDNYYLPHIKGYKRSWDTDVSLLKNHILPALKDKHLDEIKRNDMVSIFTKHRSTHKPGSTNRIIILCRYIFNCAIKWEIEGAGQNPTSGIDLYQENNKLERYLSSDEAKRLFEELDKSQAKMLKPIITMLLLTGARKNEVLQAKWEDFDFERRLWRIEKNKTGTTRHVPLNDGAIQLLQSMTKHDSSEYAFPNPDTGKPYTQIFHAWNTVRKRAGLDELRIHDLRHSFASFLVNSGRSLYEVQKILGHTQIKTTQRYAHLANDTLVDASNAAFKALPLIQLQKLPEVPMVTMQ